MPFFMVQASYTSEAWAAQIKNPQDRFAAIAAMAKANGSEVHSAFYAFGEYDVVIIFDSPNNVDAAGFLIAAAGGGALTDLKTTVLLAGEEGQSAIAAAGGQGYAPPA
jgi:uncharacterized protein with GYD domain